MTTLPDTETFRRPLASSEPAPLRNSPLLYGLLFALYHGWQLYSFVTVLLLGTALGTVVWWKRDIRLSISLHVFANVLTRLMFLMAALAL